MLTSKDKALSVLGYFGILFFLPMLCSDNQQYGKYHANQGLILLVFGIASGIVTKFTGFIPLVGWIIAIVVSLFTTILWIVGIVNAATGKMQPLPIIGELFVLIQY